jgi:hypothetical protein
MTVAHFTSRRAWLLAMAALAVGTPVTLREWRRLRLPSAEDLERLLRSRLGDRNLAPDAIPRFAHEYVSRYGAFAMSRREKETVCGLWDVRVLRPFFSVSRTQHLVEMERRLISQFLRSTDYFRRPAEAPARYVAFNDPYATVCSNPFARFDL